MEEAAPSDATQVVLTSPSDPDAGSAGNGRDIYVRACQFCHGASGEGGHDGVALSAS